MIKRDLVSILDIRDDFNEIVNLGLKLKRSRYQANPVVEGRSMGMIFEKSSTRTRVSLETAMYQLGGNALYLNPSDMQMGRGETVEDTSRVLSGMLDIITYRAFDHANVVKLAKFSSVPVINALDDKEHPLQMIADFMTIAEKIGSFQGKKFSYVGDGNNMVNSLVLTCAMTGMDISIGTPKKHAPDQSFIDEARKIAKQTGSKVALTDNPAEAVESADIIYTDVWVSMGEEKQREEKERDLKPFQVNSQLVKNAKKDYIFMHCLPAHKGLEVTEEVAESINSVIFQEAENRLHSAKAAIVYLLSH